VLGIGIGIDMDMDVYHQPSVISQDLAIYGGQSVAVGGG
jgi:hypothetical protein